MLRINANHFISGGRITYEAHSAAPRFHHYALFFFFFWHVFYTLADQVHWPKSYANAYGRRVLTLRVRLDFQILRRWPLEQSKPHCGRYQLYALRGCPKRQDHKLQIFASWAVGFLSRYRFLCNNSIWGRRNAPKTQPIISGNKPLDPRRIVNHRKRPIETQTKAVQSKPPK